MKPNLYKPFGILVFILSLICSAFLQAQADYFQQEVNYKINVTLNDEKHSLSAKEEFSYINNSTTELTYIYIHLWPNAYKNKETALAKQLLQLNKTEFFFSDPEQRGFIDSLNFTVNNKTVKIEFDPDHIDICKLILNEPLKPRDTILVSTPFYLKIPDASFSRLGHTGQAYFITQWYPKPAVFDNKGWHPMPYLDQGEFYSEFGSFEVSITLPKNYVLAATGDRVNAVEEENFLNENVGRTIQRLELGDYKEYDMGFPPSSKEFKTITFKQYRVHDFAWFADKRFNVLHDQFELPNTKRIVDSWAFFTNKNFPLWKNAIDYLNESTFFYSYMLGDYPYNNVNAIDGTIMAGGGMEYPNITVIGDASSPFELDVTITHEVGHNWFYGILGSNERDKAWMDEGLNSLYELRYIRAKYPNRKLSAFLGLDSTTRILGLNKTPYWKDKETAYLFAARAGNDQAINIPSEDFTSMNYGSIVYAKTAALFDYLTNYMGEDNFDKAMQFYYDKFKFTHPSEGDLQKTLTHFNGAELDWFFGKLLNTTDKIDYKMKSIRKRTDGSYSMKIKNKTGTLVPFAIYAYNNDKIRGMVWSNGFTGKKEVGFPAIDAERFEIDGIGSLPEINRKNNSIRSHGIFKRSKPLKIRFLSGLEDSKARDLYFLPMGGVNFYNGAMAGIYLHNYGLYQKKFEFFVSPMYAFKTKTPVGTAEFNYNILPKSTFRMINIGVSTRSFAYDVYHTAPLNSIYWTNYRDLNLNYLNISPFISFELKKRNANSPYNQQISYTNHNLFTEIQDVDTSTYRTFATEGPKKKRPDYFVNELRYELKCKRAIDPYDFNFSMQHTDKMAKVSGEFTYHFTFTKKHDLSIRAFAGAFVAGSETDKGLYAFRASGYNGYHDYTFSENFVARNERQGFGFSQFTENDGAMKIWTPLGQSTQWIASINIKSPKIFILPIKIFADVVTSDGRSMLNEKVLWCAGANIVLWKDIIDIYIPAAYSKDVQTTLDINNVDFWNKIRFTLNLHKLVPKKIIKENLLF